LAISIQDKMEIYIRAFLVGTLLVAFAIPATASAFWNGTVIGVKNWDVLNVRMSKSNVWCPVSSPHNKIG
jgi:hypothetical protein